MNTNKHALPPWAMMREAKEAIGITHMQRIFSIGHVQIRKFCRNLDFTAESARTPLERMRMLVHEVHEAGGDDLACAMLNFMAEGIGLQCCPVATGKPDKADVREECLNDLPPLAAIHQAIMAHEDIAVVQAQAEIAKREIDETVVSYRESLENS